ncbi:MAG: DUF2723 domain-containing protein [Bacteroidaceae bacterium]|nr:DUF2723 domain-containing protein [Bacteroidaceae bacterium]
MKHFRLVDNLMGWLTFAIAAIVYCSTVEPTASFWDCPEFITTAYKLEVGHPPGAPFFMLTANLFTQFVNDPAKVALMVNMMSALFSAACIMFLFWSISHLARKLVGEDGKVQTLTQLITVEASALTGALVYTFSDTFWFSAVEGEVYAYSSLFTAVVFWLMLKWEDHADEPGSDRWLILIAYLTGLSIGVHLLNLLCLPALVLIFYYRKVQNATMKGALLWLAGSAVLICAVLYGIVPGIVKVGGWFELLFVNTFNLPFNTGVIVYIAMLVAVVLWSIWETIKQKSRTRMVLSYMLSVAMLGIPFYGYGWVSIFWGIVVLAALYVALIWKNNGKHVVTARLMNTSLLCMLMIMIGYSSYAVIVIRSSANTPMDQNSPEDIFTLGTYLSREQYGDRPLFYGPAYTSQVLLKPEGNYCVPVSKQGAPVYQRKEKKTPDEPDRYEIQRYKTDYVYQQNMLFPRMFSADHARAYESWMGGVKGTTKSYERCGNTVQIKTPTQLENLRFFLSYQVNFMYWRYFMWNFAGRQNDQQSYGEWEHGNWITGIPFIDNLRLGDQSKLPSELRENKGHNVFYCLPLLLGIIGILWQLFKNDEENRGEGEKQFGVVFFLFFMTGLAIVLYLNQTPMQPRERDYAYAGSFYAYSIWVGLGVAGIARGLRKLLKDEKVSTALACLCILVPVQMASQTWDDHDRSGRYTCRDFGRNYLESLSKGNFPIIYTNGDNDTFPLWYAQETEGFRTDARVCNLSYLQTDWYIDQMKRPAYDSPPVPIHWSRLQYVAGTREGVTVQPGTLESFLNSPEYQDNPELYRDMLGDDPFELKNIIDKWILNDNPDMRFIPTDSIVVTVDKEAVRRSGMMIAADSIPDKMHISLKGKRTVYKSELMMYEMIAQCNWERPIYMAMTVGSENKATVQDFFVQEGLAYRITPFNTKKSGKDIDSDKMYENLMTRFAFGGIDEPGIYLDETVMRMCSTHRRIFATLASQLLQEGKPEKAAEVLEKAEKEIPSYNVPHSYASGSITMAYTWSTIGEKEKAAAIASPLATQAKEYIEWYLSLPDNILLSSGKDWAYYFIQMNSALVVLKSANSERVAEVSGQLETYFQTLLTRLVAHGRLSEETFYHIQTIYSSLYSRQDPPEETMYLLQRLFSPLYENLGAGNEEEYDEAYDEAYDDEEYEEE